MSLDSLLNEVGPRMATTLSWGGRHSKFEARNSNPIQIFQKQEINLWLFGIFEHLVLDLFRGSIFGFGNTPF